MLLPRIEYRLQSYFLDEKTCNILTAQYRKILKNKCQIAGTIPNSTIYHKGIYNLKSIWEVQLESQISNLLNRLNDKGDAGTSTVIRLKQFQLKAWNSENLFKVGIPENANCINNFNAEVFKQANKLKINFENHDLEKLFEWKGGTVPIKEIARTVKQYNIWTKGLKKREIIFLDQIVEKSTNNLLSWPYIINTRKGSKKGPIEK